MKEFFRFLTLPSLRDEKDKYGYWKVSLGLEMLGLLAVLYLILTILEIYIKVVG